jgi:tRNA/tmRNA/rRNA uracil-C5-methylase (TrmA/RlmC/RlmD family)
MLNRPDIDWLGIDHERCAIDDAQHNAKQLGSRYTFRVGDGEHWLRKLAGRSCYSVIILHAMRMPFGPSFMKLAGTMKPRRVIYIAPNPTALFKDIDHLKAYELNEIVLLDHTPGSGHYLTVAVLSQSLKAAGNRD